MSRMVKTDAGEFHSIEREIHRANHTIRVVWTYKELTIYGVGRLSQEAREEVYDAIADIEKTENIDFCRYDEPHEEAR